jgi:triphosphoribosyl-dephospho-CoA synthase
MDAATFLRSIASLRGYFVDIADAGARGAAFAELRGLGIVAERRMLAATQGANTHRGAIFTLGLLAAAAGVLAARGVGVGDPALRDAVRTWHDDLVVFTVDGAAPASHGRYVAARYGASGARGEALRAFPAVFDIALPALRDALARGAVGSAAQMHAFFALLARVDDTNVLYRSGRGGLAFMQRRARAFLAAGSVFDDDWRTRAHSLHREASARGISPGGCADLLAACWFVHLLRPDA